MTLNFFFVLTDVDPRPSRRFCRPQSPASANGPSPSPDAGPSPALAEESRPSTREGGAHCAGCCCTPRSRSSIRRSRSAA